MIDPARRTQIIRLLETRDDHLPLPVRRDHRPPGFTHGTTARETCSDCLANDRAMFGCETCGGRGYIETERERDPMLDPKQPVFDKSSQALRDRQGSMDSEISRLDRQLAEPWKTSEDEIADANKHPEQWEIERDRKWRDYDYEALHVALECLRDRDLPAYQAVHSVWVYKTLMEASTTLEAVVERGLAFIDVRMPATIRAPRLREDEPEPALAKESLHRGKTDRHREARERRVDRVVRAHVEWGWSTEQIAAHESLTRRRVQQLLAEHAGTDAAVASGPAA